MGKTTQQASVTILDAAERLLRRTGSCTVEQVAREARCAKGLVHYHFRTKASLLASVTSRVGARRRDRWTEAFRAATPNAAIARSWELLVSETGDGTIRAWTVLCAQQDKVTGRTVRSEVASFAGAIAEASAALLRQLGLAPTVQVAEIGLLLAGVVNGMGLQLEAGTPPADLEGAYAAAWLGVLSLTAPTRP